MNKYLKITMEELKALVETASVCEEVANDSYSTLVANRAKKAYNNVLKRNEALELDVKKNNLEKL
jgi:hypothetical protein